MNFLHFYFLHSVSLFFPFFYIKCMRHLPLTYTFLSKVSYFIEQVNALDEWIISICTFFAFLDGTVMMNQTLISILKEYATWNEVLCFRFFFSFHVMLLPGRRGMHLFFILKTIINLIWDATYFSIFSFVTLKHSFCF